METTDSYRRSLKRKNYSAHTVKSYMNILAHFTRWLAVPLSRVTRKEIGSYVDHLLAKRLSPKTITCHLQTIRLFFEYCINEEEMATVNPVTKVSIRLPRPLPRHLKDDQVGKFLAVITDARDRALFMVMLRCGLRVEEVAHLTVDAVELSRSRLLVANGKGGKDRVVYLSKDARSALEAYLTKRSSKARAVFLVQKGPMTGRPLSVRGIQKRIEYYAQQSGVGVSCHCLRHTFATQLLNADADLASIQDLMGHSHITTTQRYCQVSNLKVQRDYYTAIERVMQRGQEGGADVDTSVKSWPCLRSGTSGRSVKRPDHRLTKTAVRLVRNKKEETRSPAAEKTTRLAPEERKGPLKIAGASSIPGEGRPVKHEAAHEDTAHPAGTEGVSVERWSGLSSPEEAPP